MPPRGRDLRGLVVSDLRVDYALLTEARASLEAIASEFASAAQRRDDSARIWGADAVRDAMDDFVGEWERHRRLLTEDLRTFGAKVDGMIQAFESTDRELADTLAEAVTSSPEPSGPAGAAAPSGAPTVGGPR